MDRKVIYTPSELRYLKLLAKQFPTVQDASNEVIRLEAILNQTYMGVIAYGKSYSNNYLEQKRINNRDKTTYICVEGNFPAIISQEDWYKVQQIKAGRMMDSFNPQTGKKVRHSVQENRDLWGSRLRCSCGCSFRKNRWHKNANAPDSFGYQCYNILNNGSGKQRREAGADDTGYCDQPMIADWKLEMMGKAILEQVFGEQRDMIQYTIDLIRQCYRSQKPKESNLTSLHARMEQIRVKKERLLDMRTDGEIEKEEFLAQRQKLDAELEKLNTECERLSQTRTIEFDQPQWGRIEDALQEILDLSQPKPSPDLIRKFVSQIIPDGKSNFRWYLNLDGENSTVQDMTVDGRKNHASVTFGGKDDAPPDGSAVINILDQNTYLSLTQHRLPSRANGLTQ